LDQRHLGLPDLLIFLFFSLSLSLRLRAPSFDRRGIDRKIGKIRTARSNPSHPKKGWIRGILAFLTF
jgi:hypothetical protein